MASFRVEAEFDPVTGKYSAKLFYPPGATRPVAKTSAIYDTESDAVRRISEMFAAVPESPE